MRELFSAKVRRGRGLRRLPKIRDERRLARDVRISPLEDRLLLAVDFGDAPDALAGTGNYKTRDADGGPKHTIVAGIRLGASVDGEPDAAPTARANGDDVNLALPIDEDGVVSRQTDLIVTAGTVPTITLRATNTSGLARGTFNFTVNDAGMGIVSAPMTINVTAVNDVLVAQPRTVTTNEDTAKTFAYSDFPFTDVEGNGLVSITVSSLSLAAGDTLLVNKGAGLLGIMAFGQHEGRTERDPEVRRLFTREALLASDWYRERLTTKQQRNIALWQRHCDDLAKALTEYGEANITLADTIRQRQVIAAAQLARVQRPEYMTELIGTLGAEPLLEQPTEAVCHRGHDEISGGNGNDVCAGQAGADNVSGDAGNDSITGGGGGEAAD